MALAWYVLAPWWTLGVLAALFLASRHAAKGALGMGAVLLLGLVIVEPGRLATCAFAFSFVLVSAGAGRKLLRLAGGLPESRALRLAWSFALGHGALSTALALFGSFSLLGGVVPLGILLFAGGVCWREMRETLREAVSCLREWNAVARAGRFVLGTCVLVFFASVCLTFLPHIHSGVADYDVLEYHLGLPREFVREGRVAVFEHNFFSGMPLLAESGYVYCVALVGDPMRAATAARLLNLAALVAAAVACAGAGGVWAGAMAFGTLITLNLSGGAMVEPFWMMNSACALSALLSGNALAAGLFSGLCAAVKYPALACGTVPLAAGAVVVWAKHRRKDLLRFALAAAAACAFWPLRSAVVAHNPVFPFGGGRGWTAGKAERLRKGVAPVGIFRRRGPYEAMMLPAAVCFFLPVGVLALRDRRRWVLFIVLGGHVVMWLLVTNRIDRFLVPALPAAAIVAGAGAGVFKRTGAWACAGLLALVLPFGLGAPFLTRVAKERPFLCLERLTGAVADEEALSALAPAYGLVRAVNSLPGGRVLLVGEAETYYFREGVSYATPFDGDPFLAGLEEGTLLSTLRKLADEFDYLAIAWDECARLKNSYGLGPAPAELRLARERLRPLLVWSDGRRAVYSLRDPSSAVAAASALHPPQRQRRCCGGRVGCNSCYVARLLRRAARRDPPVASGPRSLLLVPGSVDGCEAAGRGLSVFPLKVVPGAFHREDDLVEGDAVTAVREERIVRAVERARCSEGVPFDARDLDQPRDGVAGEPQVMLHSHLRRVLDLLRRPAHELRRGGRGHGAGRANLALAADLGPRDGGVRLDQVADETRRR